MRRSTRPQPELGTAIRQLRQRSGATQQAIARKAGIAVPNLSEIESGHANPTWATVRDIAAALGISVAELAKAADRLDG